MKRLIWVYIFIAAAVYFTGGCSKQESKDFTRAGRMLSNMHAYTTTAEIIVNGNRQMESYMVRQSFVYPDRYRLEVLGPKDKRGKITIYDGEKLYIYHPQINQSFILEDYKESGESMMFPGYFIKNLLCGENAEYGTKRDGAGEYVTIKVEIPGGNNYRKYQLMYMDKKTMLPVKMEILDASMNTMVTVIYRDFRYNEIVDENQFKK